MQGYSREISHKIMRKILASCVIIVAKLIQPEPLIEKSFTAQ